MEDKQIVDLYWARSEQAIAETAQKYGGYCSAIASGILRSRQDSEECVSDTWLRAWNAMPIQRPERLSAFLGKITRNLALNRLEKENAQKRGSGQYLLSLEELGDCIPARDPLAQATDTLVITQVLNRFLAQLPEASRRIFLQRYWYFRSIRQIAADCRLSESKVKMTLLRARGSLRQLLEQEGIVL